MKRIAIIGAGSLSASIAAAMQALSIDVEIQDEKEATFELHAPPEMDGRYITLATQRTKSKCKKHRREARGWS